MNKKVSIATLSAFLVATSPAMAVNEANTLYVNLELSLNRTTVGMIIQSISEQTGYEFSYDESILSKEISKVSVRVKNEHIESVLKKVFKNTDISYRIVDNRIFLQDNAKTENVSFASVQQVKRTIRGTVVDNTGLPVIGANVIVKGSAGVGTVTNVDGDFTLEGIEDGATLMISYIGYVDQEVAVAKGKNDYKITIHEDTQNLDEVVVVGYGTQTKVNLTGAVSTIGKDELINRPVTNVSSALQGLTPGVTITSGTGQPGSDGATIRVRGVGTLNNANPYILVDGIETGTFDSIDPNDIESISVLKDAASAAIYGSKAANGVILVTTKRGKAGKATVSYNGNVSFSNVSTLIDRLSSYDYARLYNQLLTQDGASPRFTDEDLRLFQDGTDPYGHPNTVWTDYIYRTGFMHKHSLNVSGGSEDVKYMASAGFLGQEGTLRNSDRQQFNLRTNLDIKLSDKFTMRTNMAFIHNDYSEPNASYGGGSTQLIRQADRIAPWIPYKKEDGSYGSISDGNPAAWVDINSRKYHLLQNFSGILAFDYHIIDGLTFTLQGAYVTNIKETKDYRKECWYDDVNYHGPDQLGETISRWSRYTLDALLNYDKTFNQDHHFKAMVGYKIEKYDYRNLYAFRKSFPNSEVTDLNGGDSSTQTNSGYSRELALLSYFGRLNYDYKGKYLLTATFRADGSSKFAPSHQWGYFPAAAAAWRISDEAFMENTRDWLDNLKLRVSYGTSGSDNIDASLWRETWKTKQITVDGEKVTTYVPGDMKGNPDLKWETTISRNLGVDFGFFNNWVRGSLDYYWNTTKNILMKVPIDAASGYSYQFQNVGKTSNKGIELALGFDIVRGKDFNLGVNLTYNYNKNNIDELMDGVLADTRAMNDWGSSMAKPAYDYIIREGRPVGTIQGFKSEGYYTIDDFTYADGKYTLKPGIPDIQGIVNYPDGVKVLAADGQTAVPGMPKFADTTGNGVVDEDDKTIIGEAMPQHTGGFTINGNWKAIDFSVGFTYQIGGDVYNANAMHSLMGNKDNSAGQNRLKFVSETFKYYDVDTNGDLMLVKDPTALAALNANTNYSSFFSEYGIVSSKFIEDASYLRLNTLTVGYTFPKNWMNKIGLQNARVYFTGSNLFCIDGYSGIDPDVNTKTDGKDGFPTPYFDYQSYPKARTYTFGVNLTF